PPADTESRRLVTEARESIRRGEWAHAEELLEAASARMSAARPESELREWPRGLVSYREIGARGEPPGPEEDPVANRLLLVQRLLSVRAAQGRSVDRLTRLLNEVDRELRAGRRDRARELLDEVHRALEADDPPPR
ncbi:MAG TPA: hypothetical protein VEY07_06430, partial [Thermoplasmata archaeon]|nr:hypothetical protein [Thermoplasmata archaeon]